MSFQIKGLDELQRKLSDLSRRASALDGQHSVPFSELFTPAFLRANTQFSSVEQMFERSGFTVNSNKDFEAIPDGEWNTFIKTHTRFSSWEEMQHAAAAAWTTKKLGL